MRLLYVAGADFAGYDRGGLYDDAVFGTRHFTHFDRIAFVANDGPYMRAVLAMNGLMPARLRVFGLSEIAAAEEWLRTAAARPDPVDARRAPFPHCGPGLGTDFSEASARRLQAGVFRPLLERIEEIVGP